LKSFFRVSVLTGPHAVSVLKMQHRPFVQVPVQAEVLQVPSHRTVPPQLQAAPFFGEH
jgi:hypothetical protein